MMLPKLRQSISAFSASLTLPTTKRKRREYDAANAASSLPDVYRISGHSHYDFINSSSSK